MNIRDLRYLVALIDHNHFGKAADACFVSQPALSMQIKKLEEEFEVSLLERSNKTFMITEIGKLLAEKAREILNQVQELKETAKRSKDPYSGELRMGIIPTIAPYLLPYIMKRLQSAFPKLTLYLVEEQTAIIVEKLKQGKLDAIIALPMKEENFSTVNLFEEAFMLAVPNTHPLSKRKILRQAELENSELLLLEEGHCFREQALEVCQAGKARESQSFRATSLETLRHMVASGTGITLIPQLAQKENDGISYVAFKSPRPSRLVAMLWRESCAKEKLLNDVAVQVKKIMEKNI